MEHKTQDIKKQHGYQHKTTMTQLGHEDIKKHEALAQDIKTNTYQHKTSRHNRE